MICIKAIIGVKKIPARIRIELMLIYNNLAKERLMQENTPFYKKLLVRVKFK